MAIFYYITYAYTPSNTHTHTHVRTGQVRLLDNIAKSPRLLLVKRNPVFYVTDVTSEITTIIIK